MRCRRTVALVVAITVTITTAAACSGSGDKTVTADGGTTSAPAATTAPTGPDVSTGASTTASTSTVPLSAQCKARRDGALKPGAMDDLHIQSGGIERTYRRFVPTTANGSVPAPLVLDLHGLTSPIGGEVLISGFEQQAERVGAIVLTPLGGGPGPSWNVTGAPTQPDDVAFLADLVTATEQSACIDPTRVFAMGMSMGAQMTSRLACSLADRIAAFATVAGLTFPPGCAPTRPVPIVAFHGTADGYLAFEGGLGTEGRELVAGLPGGAASPAAATLASLDLAPIPTVAGRWAVGVDRCDDTPTTTTVSPHVTRHAYRGCRAGSEVELYVVAGGGHSWPGSTGSAKVESLLGPTTMEIDADDLIWAFFEAHPLPS